MKHFPIGARVGAHRWPYSAAHPDCWLKPYAGEVLADDDPRAWAGTIAFPTDDPDPVKVCDHVAWCKSQGLLSDVQPVLWEFGRVHWEKSLIDYGADYAEWFQARSIAFHRCRFSKHQRLTA